jgi:hypothetical protein
MKRYQVFIWASAARVWCPGLSFTYQSDATQQAALYQLAQVREVVY